MLEKIIVFCVYGGKSTEHEVSLLSAKAMSNSLDREKYSLRLVYITEQGAWVNLGEAPKHIEDTSILRGRTDKTPSESIADFLRDFPKGKKAICLLALHGTNGEDGRIQGLFDMAEIPYTGDDCMSSSLNMDKSVMKTLLSEAKIPQTKYLSFTAYDYNKNPDDFVDRAERELGYPMFVKPANGGSSVGTSRAANREEFKESISLAFKYDYRVVCEREIVGREIQISVLGLDEPKASVPGEFIMERPFFDYDAKYIDKKIIPIAPARMSAETMEKMRDCAVRAYKATRVSGLARVDFFITEDESFYVCELNTMPGFTELSFTPVLWGKTDGTTYQGVVEKLIEMGFESYERRKKLSRHR